jgi:hypothetical protein
MKFKEYLKEQAYDIKGMYSYGNGETSIKGSKIGIPPAYTPKVGIKNLRVGVEALAGWTNPVAIEACLNMMNFFGTPNILTSSKAKWFKIAGFDKVCVNDEAIPNYTPKFHVECVYGTKNTMVSAELHTPLAAVSQSFMFDNLKQQITARCSSIVGCAIMMGFAEDVMSSETEPDVEEYMERFESMDVPDWFERATGGVGAFLEFEDRKQQEDMMRKEMMRTGGKYGRGYHQKIGEVPMDMEQDLNIKEANVKESKVIATWKNGSLSWKADWKHRQSGPGELMVSSGPRWKSAPSREEVKKHLEKVLGKSFALDYKVVNEGKGLGVHILKNPKGTYSFKGTVPVELAWVNKDGSELNTEQAKEVARANNPAMIAKARVFRSSKEALKAAKKFKTGVTSVDEQINVDWKILEDPDEEEYLNDVLEKAKVMGDNKMVNRIMAMLKSKEKNITNEYP